MEILSTKAQDLLANYAQMQPDKSVIDSQLSRLQEEGFKLFLPATQCVPLLEGICIPETPLTNRVDFQCLIGLGAYDDLIPWINANQIELFPIGSWNQLDIYVGEDWRLYLTEYSKIIRLLSDLPQAVDSLLFRDVEFKWADSPPSLI